MDTVIYLQTVHKLQDVKPLMEESEVIKRLRERGEPIKLFGEIRSETYQRLRSLEMKEPSGSKSQTDFKSAMEKIDQVTFLDVAKSRLFLNISEGF